MNRDIRTNLRGAAFSVAGLAAALVATCVSGAPHGGTSWVALPDLDLSDPCASTRYAYSTVDEEDGSVTERWTLPVPAGRFGPMVGQILIERVPAPDSTAGEGALAVGDEEALPWTLGGSSDNPSRFRVGSAALRTEDGKGAVRSVEVRLRRPPSARPAAYRFVHCHEWDGVDGERSGALALSARGDVGAQLDSGIVHLFDGDVDAARQAFAVLAGDADADIARAGRRCLRRADALDGLGHAADAAHPGAAYDAALYAWANGFYDIALKGFRSAADLAPADPMTLYHWAEMEERAAGAIDEVAEIFFRAGLSANAKANPWEVLVTILMEATADDGSVIRMTQANVERIVRDWQIVEKMVYGASLGRYRLDTTYRVVPDTDALTYAVNAGWLYGPTDEAVSPAGAFDSCMSFRPNGPSVTGGADCGPNRAALTDIGTWCGWEVYLHEWNHQFDWGMITSEIGVGYPVTHDSDGCGPQPIPSMGAGHRGSMRYYVTPAMYRRVELADPSVGSAIRAWSVAGPFPAGGEGGEPKARLLDEPVLDDEHDLSPSGGLRPGSQWLAVLSPTDFVDLNAALDADGRDLVTAFAHAYVFVPSARETRLWLGHNDGMKVWVNGREVHEGRYYSIAKWEDGNLADTVVSWAPLEAGWNRVLCKVQKWDGDWGFSVRLCDFDGMPWPDLRAQCDVPDSVVAPAPRPGRGRYYAWAKVRDDFTAQLPVWTDEDLAKHTGLPDLRVRGGAQANRGTVILDPGEDFAALPGSRLASDPASEDDMELNNVMAWATEGVAAIRFGGETGPCDLLLVKAECIEPVTRLLAEQDVPPGLPASVADRVLGYVMTAEGTSPRALVLFEAYPGDWPQEEEGLYRASR